MKTVKVIYVNLDYYVPNRDNLSEVNLRMAISAMVNKARWEERKVALSWVKEDLLWCIISNEIVKHDIWLWYWSVIDALCANLDSRGTQSDGFRRSPMNEDRVLDIFIDWTDDSTVDELSDRTGLNCSFTSERICRISILFTAELTNI